MAHDLFIVNILCHPTTICEVRCPDALLTPAHIIIGAHPLIKTTILEAFATKGKSRQNMDDPSSLSRGKQISSTESDKRKNEEEDEDPSLTIAVDAEDLEIHKDDVDWLITTGVNMKCLSNPLQLPAKEWTKNIIELWLCRIPLNENQNLELVNIAQFRRYGTRRLFELECIFRLRQEKRSLRSGRSSSQTASNFIDSSRRQPSRKFWIHICVLEQTPQYKAMLIKQYHWNWNHIEYDFNEMLDGYGSDESDIFSSASGEVYAVTKKNKTQKSETEDGNYYKRYNIHEIAKLSSSRGSRFKSKK